MKTHQESHARSLRLHCKTLKTALKIGGDIQSIRQMRMIELSVRLSSSSKLEKNAHSVEMQIRADSSHTFHVNKSLLISKFRHCTGYNVNVVVFTSEITRSSADADKPARRVCRSVSSPNVIPFDMLGMVSC